MIHDGWDFSLSAVLHSVTVVVVTATGDGQTLNNHVMARLRSTGVIDLNL